MKYVICKQEKALKGKILTSIVLVFSFFFLFNQTEPFLPRVILFVVALLIFGFSVAFKISKDFKNKKVYSFFSIPFFAVDLNLEFPDYVSVFSTSFKLSNEWSTVSALGTSEKHDRVVIRFFKDNRHYTVYKTKYYKLAVEKANELGEMLNVEVYDAIKE